MGRSINGWTLVTGLLVVVIIAAAIVIWLKYSPAGEIEITLEPEPEPRGSVYIGGEVNNPGFYPWREGDGLEDLLRAAGGATDEADPDRIELIVPRFEDGAAPQKININTAEAWLLAALPGIGEGRASAIIEYRQQNGPFRDIKELVRVEGIGDTTYENIKHLITVAD